MFPSLSTDNCFVLFANYLAFLGDVLRFIMLHASAAMRSSLRSRESGIVVIFRFPSCSGLIRFAFDCERFIRI